MQGQVRAQINADGRDAGAGQQAVRFIERHRAALVAQVNALCNRRVAGPAALALVGRVLDDFEAIEPDVRGEPVSGVERAFWFVCYQLENLAEHPATAFADPYVQLMLADLGEVAAMLMRGEPLPARFFATRPGEAVTDEMP